MNESMHRQGVSLDCGNWLDQTKCIDIAQATTCVLSWLWTESVQFSSWEIEPRKTYIYIYVYISHFTNTAYQTFF